MRDLRLVGMSEDRRYLVLRNETGEHFRVPADERLGVVVRGDRPRLGQVEIAMDSALRPRDIQARIRAGDSPEAVAAAAKMPLDKVMVYAVPVLAEREHMCGRAQRATIRRKHTSGPTRLLGDAVDEQLRAVGIDPYQVAWDSWRREDGRWAIQVTADAGPTGTYVFDVPGLYVVAADDGARALIADTPPANDPTEMAIASAVAEAQFSGAPSGAVTAAEPTEPSVTSIQAARSLRETIDEAPPPPEIRAQARAVGDDDLDALARATSTEQNASPASGLSRRRRRPSVPSWDEIMLGGGKPPRE